MINKLLIKNVNNSKFKLKLYESINFMKHIFNKKRNDQSFGKNTFHAYIHTLITIYLSYCGL